MRVIPPHHHLQNGVKSVQFDLRRDNDSAPDGRRGVFERDFDLKELHGSFLR
jgi:hypothetical protein